MEGVLCGYPADVRKGIQTAGGFYTPDDAVLGGLFKANDAVLLPELDDEGRLFFVLSLKLVLGKCP